jgi:hypothetical protein
MLNQKEYYREYRIKNRERINEVNRIWRDKNKQYINKDKTARTYWKSVFYTVWNNYTDEIVIVDGTAEECCKVMGIARASFNAIVTRTKQGKYKKWFIETRKIEKGERE